MQSLLPQAWPPFQVELLLKLFSSQQRAEIRWDLSFLASHSSVSSIPSLLQVLRLCCPPLSPAFLWHLETTQAFLCCIFQLLSWFLLQPLPQVRPLDNQKTHGKKQAYLRNNYYSTQNSAVLPEQSAQSLLTSITHLFRPLSIVELPASTPS